MKIAVKFIDQETGDVTVDGNLNRNEVALLLGYAMNDLLAAGVEFHLNKDEPGEDDEPRFKLNPDINYN